MVYGLSGRPVPARHRAGSRVVGGASGARAELSQRYRDPVLAVARVIAPTPAEGEALLDAFLNTLLTDPPGVLTNYPPSTTLLRYLTSLFGGQDGLGGLARGCAQGRQPERWVSPPRHTFDPLRPLSGEAHIVGRLMCQRRGRPAATRSPTPATVLAESSP